MDDRAQEDAAMKRRLYETLTHLKPDSQGKYIPRCLDENSAAPALALSDTTSLASQATAFSGDDSDEEDGKEESVYVDAMDVISEHNTVSEATSQHTSSFFSAKSKVLRFGSVEVREYLIGLGDNPACLFGPPLSLSWKYRVLPSVQIDQFEKCRIGLRRNIYEMHLNSYVRQYILERAGYQQRQIKKVQYEVSKTQRRRRRTVAMMPLHRLSEQIGRLHCDSFDIRHG